MLAISSDVFSVEDLQKGAAGLKRFSSRDTQFLAGRCLLDAIEYLRIDPKFPGIFLQLVNAHAMRLLVGCLEKLKRRDVIKRIEPQMKTQVRKRGLHTARRWSKAGLPGVRIYPSDRRAAARKLAHRVLQLRDIANVEAVTDDDHKRSIAQTRAMLTHALR